MATVRDPAIGPRRQTQARPPTAKDTSASAGNPTHFQPCTASHQGHFDSGEDPRPRWQTTWVFTKVDADPAPSAERSRPKGRVVLPIFIPQGRPPAMSHLSGIEGSALCGPAFSQVARERQGRSNAFFVSLLHAVQAARPIRLLIIPVVRWRLAAQPSPSLVRDGRRSPPRAKGPPPPLR